MIYPLNTVIFHSYISLPEGIFPQTSVYDAMPGLLIIDGSCGIPQGWRHSTMGGLSLC